MPSEKTTMARTIVELRRRLDEERADNATLREALASAADNCNRATLAARDALAASRTRTAK